MCGFFFCVCVYVWGVLFLGMLCFLFALCIVCIRTVCVVYCIYVCMGYVYILVCVLCVLSVAFVMMCVLGVRVVSCDGVVCVWVCVCVGVW